MYTPESLLEESVRQEKIYLALLEQFPPGTVHEGRNQAYKIMTLSILCAKWMQSNGHTALAHVGPFVSAPFNVGRTNLKDFSGARVRIRSGATVKCLNPRKPLISVIERSRVVTLYDIYSGQVMDDGTHQLRQAEVVWSGTGGYWHSANLNDVELISMPPKSKKTV